jgi:glutaredoxin 3
LDRKKALKMKIQVYGYGSRPCQSCNKVKELLTTYEYDFVYHPIDTDPAAKAELLERAPDVTTVPQVFVDDIHLGGYDITKIDLLNPTQFKVAQTYAEGEFSHVRLRHQCEEVGDTLFTFLISETSDVEDEEEALNRFNTALTDIQGVINAFS